MKPTILVLSATLALGSVFLCGFADGHAGQGLKPCLDCLERILPTLNVSAVVKNCNQIMKPFRAVCLLGSINVNDIGRLGTAVQNCTSDCSRTQRRRFSRRRFGRFSRW
ncbi:Uncharacterised protein g11002 [Pycnogonum litorale]